MQEVHSGYFHKEETKVKKYIALLIIIIFAGIGVIAAPTFIKIINDRNAANFQNFKNESLNKKMTEVSSKKDTITEPEIPFNEMEPGVQDKDQMYVIGIEVLSKYFKINQVDDIRNRIQFHIHQNIDEKLKECSIDKDNISVDNNKTILFTVHAKDNIFKVSVTNNLNITIIQ